ncbi:unnamed protein product, partial [Vitrella brassicaformis CCMP3155]
EVTTIYTMDEGVQAGEGLHAEGLPVLYDQAQLVRMLSEGLEKELPKDASLISLGASKSVWGKLWVAAENTFTIWGTVVVLILTRIKEIGLKQALTAEEPYGELPLGGLGTFRISASLSVFLRDIFTETGVNWGFQTLYVPSIIPFVLVSLLTMLLHRKRLQASPWRIFTETAMRLKTPVIALCGALSLVNLLQRAPEGRDSPATTVGQTLSAALGVGWVVIAPILGALGSFFSGSTTVANLTFGDIQRVAAEDLEMSTTSFLALQSMGAALGNMICIHNILSARTVLGVEEPEGVFIKKTALPALVYYVIGTALGALLIFTTAWWGAVDVA